MSLKMITTPRGSIVTAKNGKAELTWNSNFTARRNAQFTKKQMFIDSEVLRRCSPRVPFKTGKLGTSIGSGEVNYIAKHAAVQYYATSDTRPYDANRGAHWFERMKVAEKDDILRGADKI